MDQQSNSCSIEWLTIPAPNINKAKLFYQEVFGFQISDYSESFAVFRAANLSGGLDRDLIPSKNSISFSVTVNDIPGVLEKIERYGGEVIRSKYPLGSNLGYCARFSDPNGNILELYSEN